MYHLYYDQAPDSFSTLARFLIIRTYSDSAEFTWIHSLTNPIRWYDKSESRKAILYRYINDPDEPSQFIHLATVDSLSELRSLFPEYYI